MITDAERTQLQADLGKYRPDACRIVRRGQGAFDPGTGAHAAPPEEELYEGACRLMPAASGDQIVAGEGALVRRSYHLTLPLEAEGLLPDDVVIMTASADPELTGRELVIRDIASSSLAAERRVICEDVLGQGEEG